MFAIFSGSQLCVTFRIFSKLTTAVKSLFHDKILPEGFNFSCVISKYVNTKWLKLPWFGEKVMDKIVPWPGLNLNWNLMFLYRTERTISH